jgi:hypothetical protein
VDTDKQKQPKPVAKTAKKTTATPEVPKTFTSSAEVGVADIDRKVEKLISDHASDIKDMRGEQRNIIIGVLIALVIIVVAVAVQAIYFNTTYNTNLEGFKAQENQDIRGLENTIIQNQQNMNDALLGRPTPSP